MQPVIIEDYDTGWPQQFETLRARIATALDGISFMIEHVGSTSIPGLAAKPIIDMDVLLRSADDLPATISKLASLGYEHQGDLGIAKREAFRTPPNCFPHHLYVCLPDSDEYRRHIAFRDYLRTHPEDTAAYAQLKRELALQLGRDRNAYSEAKSRFITDILSAAK